MSLQVNYSDISNNFIIHVLLYLFNFKRNFINFIRNYIKKIPNLYGI